MGGPWLYRFGGPVVTVLATVLTAAAVLFLFFLVYLALRKTRSLARSRRCQQVAADAAKKHREGDLPGAVTLYQKADAAWSLNTYDGSRESWSKDLDLLTSITSGLVKTQAREPGTVYSDFTATVREMRDMLRERQNFGIDGRKMNPDVLVRWKASIVRLAMIRKRIRETCSLKAVARR
jgi:hypothetical protein